MGKIANDNFSLWKLNEWFARTFGSLLLSLVQILCYAVFFIEQVFWTLARGIQQPDGSYKTIFDLLVFNNGTLGESLKHNSAITDIVIFMMIVGIFLTILAMVIAIIKYHFSIKDEDQNPRIVIMGVVKAIILIIAFPFIIAVMLKISNALVDSVCTYAGISTGDAKASLANRIFFLFGEHKAEFYDATGQARFSFLMEYDGLKETANAVGKGSLLPLPNENKSIIDSTGPEGLTQFYVLYEIGFLSSLGMDCYQFVIGIAVILFLLVALFKCLLLLGKRMFDMALLYVVAPLAIASYPADDGKRYNIWKDLMMAKIFSVLGITLGFIIYMVFMREINEVFRDLNPTYYAHLLMAMGDFIKYDSPEALSGVALTVSYIVIAIAGASGLPTAYQMIATLVSETAGHQASADMSNLNADVALMQRGVHFAGGMALAGASGLLKTAGKTLYNPNGAKNMAKVGGAMAGGGAGMVFASGLTRGLSQVAHGGLLSLATNKHRMNKSIKLGDRAEAIRQTALTNWGNRGNEKAIKEYYKRTGVKLGSEDRLNFLKQQQDYQRVGINMNDSKSEEFNKRNIKVEKQVHKRAVHDLAKQIHNANKQNKGD